MKAVSCDGAGDVDVLRWATVEAPTPGRDDVIVDVVASAVNRADLMQRQGFYPPPAGVTDVLGLECSGRISRVGEGVTRWSVGDEVCALLAGGGQAEQVVVPVGQVMPVPAGVDLVTAGSLPEVCCTVWSNVVQVGRLASGEVLLVHGGGSGIGTLAIQVGKALGATVVATAGSPEKLALCRDLGADATVNYREEDFVEATRTATGGRGADVILDIIGAKYLAPNLDALAMDGRLVVIGMQGGAHADLDLTALMRTRGSIQVTGLRSRPLDQKAEICAAVVAGLWPMIADGRVRPIVGATYPMDRIADAHRLVADSGHTGKVALTVP